ncbi:MAG: cob(I)yrinic acid a,c-diamide adenosyltransferase [Candidatus Riflebacteria bacterium]|nr:cob(I)yrinic acid a,c-diamide adenosyltransferase [Candidatus Riflebacteria bacterium]
MSRKIYTRTGDGGQTGLLGGGRVPKSAPRVEAYGQLDELNSCLGVARACVLPVQVDAWLSRIQSELFSLGAEVATAPGHEKSLSRLEPLADEAAGWLESVIDSAQTELAPLRSFILPGGCIQAAELHRARTVCRRAERAIVALASSEPVRPGVIVYLNRLSDLLFVLARLTNFRAGVAETRWSSGR